MTGAAGSPAGNAADDAARRRAERRAFIRSQHPDVGGDPDAFARGLAGFDRPAGTEMARPHVRRSRRPDRVLRHKVRGLRRRLAGLPPRRLE